MDIRCYIDSTYLKTNQQAAVSNLENFRIAEDFIREAIQYKFKLIMIRPELVSKARTMVDSARSHVLVGTVIDFPLGNKPLSAKLVEAEQAIKDGADELDFVLDYNAFKKGEYAYIKEQVLECSKFVLKYNKTIKWIIEIAALTDLEIVKLSALIKNVIIANFKEDQYENVFVKSSTGFYVSKDGSPNGATLPAVKLMLENAYPLPIKAAGGIKSLEDALAMIRIGIKRIGTSSAKAIVEGVASQSDY